MQGEKGDADSPIAQQIIVQFCNAEGAHIGPELQVPLQTTVQELQALLNQLQHAEEPLPYAFKISTRQEELVEINSTVEGAVKLVRGLTSETSLKIMFYPLATFRIRPVMRCTATIQAHSEAVLTLAFTPDSRYLASGSGDTTVRIWDLDTETPIKTLVGHKSWVFNVSWAPDGQILASAGMDKMIKVWYPFKSLRKDGTTPNTTLSRHSKPVTCLAWQPLHKFVDTQVTPYLASASLDCVICVWDITRGVPLVSLTGHTMAVTQLRFSGILEGSYLYSVSRDSYVKVWDLSGGHLHWDQKGHAHWINTLALNTDYILQLAHYDHTVECRSSISLAEQIQRAKKRYTDCFKNNCGSQERLLTGSDDCTMILWEPFNTKKIVARLTGHQSPVNHVQFSPSGQYIATASFDKTVRLWDGLKGTFLSVLRGHVGRVYQLAWSPDSRYIVSGSADSTVKIWNVRLRKLERDLPGHADEVYCIAWSADGGAVASGSKDFSLKIWKH